MTMTLRHLPRHAAGWQSCAAPGRPVALLALIAAALFGGCHGDSGPSPPPLPQIVVDDYPGITQTRFALLASNCVVTASSIAVQVNAGETALVSLSSINGNVTINGTQAGGAPCEGPPTLSVSITPGTAGDHSIVLDLSNGRFSQATASNAPKIALNLGTGTNDSLVIRGTSGVDHYYLGAGTVANSYVFNFNGGATVGDDSFADVSIVGADQVVVSAGGGNDIIDASGLFGTTAPYPAALSIFGGANDDTIVGGAGNDTLSGDTGNDHLNGGAGTNSYPGGTSNDGSDVITVTTGAVDIIDYSARFNPVSVVLNNNAVSGETGENDTIPDTVSVVLGGSGNDSLSAGTSTRAHTLNGGPGNDTLTGGNGADLLVGGDSVLQVDGDDIFIGSKATADYSARTTGVTVTVNGSGSGGADANDGDPSTTRHVQSAVAVAAGGTIVAATNTVTGLSHMTAGAVGRRLIIAASSGAHDDGSYRIASVTNATTVVLNATDTAANAQWADDSSAAWTFTEDAGAEHDEVRCRNVTGSATASNTITGDVNDNRLSGGAMADILVGGTGSDTLLGLSGNDTLYGGAGDDTLYGGPGADLLYGGDGNDILQGDANSDTFACDRYNDAGTNATAPGNADYTVDYVPGAPDSDTRAAPNDCEF